MYLESGLVRGGSAIETMLVDLPMHIDPEEWGLSAIGVMTFQDEHGVTHVLDWVGADSYPEVADFVEECLLGDELIATNNGVKAIRELCPGNLVVTHRGRLRAVTDVIQNRYRGDLVEIRTAFTNQPLQLTPSHPVLAKRADSGGDPPVFVEAGDLREGDWLCFPRPQKVADVQQLTLRYIKRYKHFASSVRTAELEQRVRDWAGPGERLGESERLLVQACVHGQTYAALQASGANTYTHRSGFARALNRLVNRGFLCKQGGVFSATASGSAAADQPRRTALDVAREFGVSEDTAYRLLRPAGREHPVSRTVEVNEHLMALVGYYLAEGSTANTTPGKQEEGRRTTVEFSFGKAPKELEYADEVVAAAMALGFPAQRGTRDGCHRALIHSRHLAEFFHETFGGHSTLKRVPQWVIDLPAAKLEVLLRTYLNGDGHRRANHSVGTTVSPHLAHGLRSVALKLGHRAGIRVSSPQGMAKHALYRVIIATGKAREARLDDQYQYVRIRAVGRAPVETTVCNVTVAEDESYCTLHHALHNCRRKGVSRKISHTTPVEGLTAASCLYLLHPRGRVLNADQLGTVGDFRCPCGHGHQASEGCAGLAWHLPEGNAGPHSRKLADGTYPLQDAPQGGAAPEYGLAVFLKVPITCLTVIEHPDADVQQQREARARQSGLPVFVGVE